MGHIWIVKPPPYACYVILLVCKSGGSATALGHTKEEALESASFLKTKFPKSYVWESEPYLAGVAVDPVMGPIWDTSSYPPRNGYDPTDSMPAEVWALYQSGVDS